MENLRIYEIDYSVSPGGINSFEIYPDVDSSDDTLGYPLYETESIQDACKWAYDQGCNFTVYTLAQYHREFDMDLYDAPASTLTDVSAY